MMCRIHEVFTKFALMFKFGYMYMYLQSKKIHEKTSDIDDKVNCLLRFELPAGRSRRCVVRSTRNDVA